MARWYYTAGGIRQGQVSENKLRTLAADGKLTPSDLVWRQGMDGWIPASKVKGLFPEELPPPLPEEKPPPLPRQARQRCRSYLESDEDTPHPRARPMWVIPTVVAGAALFAVMVIVFAWGRERSSSTSSDEDLQKLQGRWKVISVVIDGVAQEEIVPPEKRELLDRSYISFEGDRMKTIFPTKSNRATILLQPGKNPKQITVTWEGGHVNGNVDDGIYELTGDQLKLCIAPRAVRARPTSFDASRQGQDVSLMTLKRDR